MNSEDSYQMPRLIRVFSGPKAQIKRLSTVKFLNFRTPLCCNLPLIQTKSLNLLVFCQNDANGIANSGDPDQTAPLGAV